MMAKAGSETLKQALAVQEAGDVLSARRLAEDVLRGEASEENRRAAQNLLSRTRMEPATFGYAVLCLGIIAALILLAILRT